MYSRAIERNPFANSESKTGGRIGRGNGMATAKSGMAKAVSKAPQRGRRDGRRDRYRRKVRQFAIGPGIIRRDPNRPETEVEQLASTGKWTRMRLPSVGVCVHFTTTTRFPRGRVVGGDATTHSWIPKRSDTLPIGVHHPGLLPLCPILRHVSKSRFDPKGRTWEGLRRTHHPPIPGRMSRVRPGPPGLPGSHSSRAGRS
jgi:hypothetical protein